MTISIYVDEYNNVIGVGESNTPFPDAKYYFDKVPDSIQNINQYRIVDGEFQKK